LKTIHDLFPLITVETLMTWATINGAACFGWKDLGAFKKDNNPGILWISKADKNKINPESVLKRIC